MKHPYGFTAVELMVALAIAAILAAVAVPSFTDMQARRRLEGAANELSADLQYARSEAVSRQTNVTLTTTATGYSITYAGGTLKTVTLPTNVSNTSGVSFVFEGLRGTASTFGNVDVSNSKITSKLRLMVSMMGRVSLCTPSDATFSGYTTCS